MQLNCDNIDNFARSKPSVLSHNTTGSVVDRSIFVNATGQERNESLAVFDFKAQVQQFMEYEKQHRRASASRTAGSTVFAVFFGIWDLLEYSTLEKDAAVDAV